MPKSVLMRALKKLIKGLKKALRTVRESPVEFNRANRWVSEKLAVFQRIRNVKIKAALGCDIRKAFLNNFLMMW